MITRRQYIQHKLQNAALFALTIGVVLVVGVMWFTFYSHVYSQLETFPPAS